MLRFFDGLYLACIWVSGLAILFMSLIIPWGVFARYVLGTGSSWPEPVAVLLMVTFTFMGAAAAYRAGGHIAVGMLVERLSVGMQKVLAQLVHWLMLVICVFVMLWGGKLVLGTMGQTLADLPWLAVGWTYLPLPVGAFLTLLFVFEVLVYGPAHERVVISIDRETSAPAQAV
ncbi:TRAP transporter small permease [Limnohabitans sp.]|jgi:TRAP-type C4-dicarboxylate transport system permease small subunit|uniref:TRAP transporter small permease n=1 Tax=Limnohabitans sp. TaxID=1907725 RepID=UPI0037C074DF